MTSENKSDEKSRRVSNEFKELPIEGKVAMLVELEIMTVAEGLQKIGECSISLGKKIMETLVPDAKPQTDRKPQTPSE